MAQGYSAGGGFLAGPVVALFETAPAICALIVPLALAFRRRKGLAFFMLLGYLGCWLSVGVLYSSRFFELPQLQAPSLWAFATTAVVATLVLLIWFLARRSISEVAISRLAVFAAVFLIISQLLSVIFVCVEDRLLLNYGAVTSAVGATALLVAVVFFHHVQKCSVANHAVGSDSNAGTSTM